MKEEIAAMSGAHDEPRCPFKLVGLDLNKKNQKGGRKKR